MKDVVILNEAELRSCVAVDAESIAAVEEAFRALATKPVAMPPILRLDIPEANGEVDVKTAYIPGLPSFAIKVSPGFFDNPKLGLPSLNGLMMVFSASTGLVQAILLDNGYLTAIRTAAAGAVAAKHLAPVRVETIGVLGAGAQARLQVAAAMLARPANRILVWARNPGQAADCARELAVQLGIPAAVVGDAADLVRESQLVITATPSRAPLIMAEALHPGLHITAMGADAPEKNEIAPAALVRADRFVCDRRSQSAALGELHHAIAAGVLPESFAAAELGEVVAGTVTGRLATDAITICDLTGTGVQDTAIATLALARASARHLGTIIRA